MPKRAAQEPTPGVSPADARRLQITSTSARLFDEFGVDAVSMDDVAKAVGLAKPTLYHYFSSKEQILFTIHKTLFDAMLAALEARLATGAPPEEQILGVLVDTFQSMQTHPGHTRVFFEHFRRLGPEYQTVVRKNQRKYERHVAKILKDGIATGAFRPIDPGLAALALFGMANWAHNWYDPKGKLSPRELAEAFYDVFLNGVRGPMPPVSIGGRKR